jgi:hypothetical protein
VYECELELWRRHKIALGNFLSLLPIISTELHTQYEFFHHTLPYVHLELKFIFLGKWLRRGSEGVVLCAVPEKGILIFQRGTARNILKNLSVTVILLVALKNSAHNNIFNRKFWEELIVYFPLIR